MTYIYDIMLNFNDIDYFYEIYEWKKNDTIVNVKKVPIFMVNDKTLYNMINDSIKVDSDFLKIIFNKNIVFKRKNSPYIVLFSNCKKTIGVSFNKNGNIINKSALLIDEEQVANNIVANKKTYNLKYFVYKNKKNYYLRDDLNKIRYIIRYLKKIYNEKKYSQIKFIYYEFFGIYEKDIKKIYNNLLNSYNYQYNLNEIYTFIKSRNKLIEK